MTATRRRLTDAQRVDRATSGLDLQRLIVGHRPPGIAMIYGWLHVHFRPAKTERGWRTPGSGELLAGWPDLVLVHPTRRRLIFAELKREIGDNLTPDQVYVRDVLSTLVTPFGFPPPSIEYFVWRPSDLTEGRIQEALS